MASRACIEPCRLTRRNRALLHLYASGVVTGINAELV